MSYWQDYAYVDAHYEHPVTHRRMRWVRLRVEEVGKRIVEKAQRANCFASIQRYKDPTSLLQLRRERDERLKKIKKANGHDLEEAERIAREAEATELPDRQLHYHGLFFDFDCDYQKLGIDEETALERSQEDVKKLVTWFQQTFDIDDPALIQIWFTGSKGFHAVIRPEIFGIQPHSHLTYIIRNIAVELAELLGLETLDRSVYTCPRQWRIPNTIHPRTGRFKIEITQAELMRWTVPRILKESRAPRAEYNAREAIPFSHLWDDIEYSDVPPDPVAVAWYRERYEHYEAYRDLRNGKPRVGITIPKKGSKHYPACIKDILENGPKDGGPNRNRVILPIAGFLNDIGLKQSAANEIIENWTRTFYPEQAKLQERIANGKSVVDSAYRGGLSFSCRFIRSLKGQGDGGSVNCVREEKCPWINDPGDMALDKIPLLHLADASKGCYIGSKVRVPIHVAAIAGKRYEIPIRGEVQCTPKTNENGELAAGCKNCPNNGGEPTPWLFKPDDRQTLNLFNVNDSTKRSTIRQQAGITPKCYRNRLEIIEESTIEELQIIPMVDYAQAYLMAQSEDEASPRKPKHAVERAFFIGHGLETNKKYMIDTYVWGHPKDQSVVFLFDKAEAAQNDIDQFEMTPELYRKLLLFQPARDQSIKDKLQEIHRDLTANVHHIGGRFDLSIAVDLAYHAIIGFRFTGDLIHKGWFELLIMGDTSTGKTSLIERIMMHYGLGELIAGEDAKRTGLVYASVQMAGQWILLWGKLPQNDRRLLVIDEFASIPAEEVGKLTQIRSEGKARGGGVNQHHETWARTRLIMLTNQRENEGKLEELGFGIAAIKRLFKESQDLRRVDFAITASEDDVPIKEVNRRWDRVTVPHQYTSSLCRSLLLWAWSREPHHVEWEPGVEDEVLLWATRLGQTYACNIPLAIHTDLRIKIARISVACAARLFSTDSDAKKVIVKKEHVQFVAQMIDHAYRKNSMSFFEYARNWKQQNRFTQERKEDVKEFLKSFDEYDNITKKLLETDMLSKPILTDMLNLEGDDMRKLWKYMVGESLIRKTTKGYRRSPAFTKFLKSLQAHETNYRGDLGDDFESGGNFEGHSEPFDSGDELEEDEEDTDYEEPPF